MPGSQLCGTVGECLKLLPLTSGSATSGAQESAHSVALSLLITTL